MTMKTAAQLPLTEIHTLEECCALEEKCAHIYRHFGKIFSDSKEISSIWEKIASEEDHHAHVFKLAIRKLKPGMVDVVPCGKKLEKIMSTLERIHREVETNHPSLVEAFELALKIEKSLAEFHINSVVKFSDPPISNLFLQMETYDQGHLELLQESIDSLL
jgi:rubrerythrin